MAYTTINKSSEYFNTKLYTGNSSTQAVTGVGFQPDWTWIKCRNDAQEPRLVDSVRGTTKYLDASLAIAELTDTNILTSFDTDGFTLGDDAISNLNGNTHVAWNWKASGTASSNTDGSITSSVSTSTTSGFSVVSYTGTGANATIGHGLGSVPKMIIVKNRDNTTGFGVYHASLGNTKYLQLNATAAEGTASTFWNNTTPTSSVFSIGTSGWMNNSGEDYVAYCFAEKQGYSKFGSYVGNGSTDGTFVYTGFKPAFVMIKNASAASTDWLMYDKARGGPASGVYGNNNKYFLRANTSGSESNESFDMLSNGFKIRISNNFLNGSGNTLIYMAFAEAPIVGSNNVPATAR